MDISYITQVITAITTEITVENVLAVLTTVIGVAIVFVAFWWGARKVTQVIMSAFRKGRISV